MTKRKIRDCVQCGAHSVSGYGRKYCDDCGGSDPNAKVRRYRAKKPKVEREFTRGCIEHGSITSGCTSCKRRTKYNVSASELAELEQIVHCEICGSDAPLVLDHNHTTDEVRGMICGPCNSALGMANDSIATLEAMITYLKERGSYGT